MASFQEPPKRGINRTSSTKASEKAAAWAAKKKAAVERAAALKAERNTKAQIEEEFNKALEAANESLVTNWTNDEFARITSSSPKLKKKPSMKSAGSSPSQDVRSPKGSKNKDEAMLKNLKKLEEAREARRKAAAQIKEHQGAVLAQHPGMAKADVSFLVMVNEWREQHKQIQGAESQNSLLDAQGDILCCIRKRPLLPHEIENKVFDVISCRAEHGAPPNTAVLHEPKEGVDLRKQLKHHQFSMNGGVFSEESSTSEVYSARVAPLVQHVLQRPGARATVFAYGQTGSGKTHTMIGSGGGEGSKERGVYALAALDLFSDDHTVDREIRVAYFELYKGQLYDLLQDHRQMELMEDGKGNVTVVGLSHSEPLHSAQELLDVISAVERSTSSTGSNDTSSRSHAILEIRITIGGQLSKLSFVDLAGSEWFDDSVAHGKETALEGAEINKSLLSLKECIRALGGKDSYGLKGDDKAERHVPFRGSKLTRLLKDSLVGVPGACKTLMIAQVSPASGAWEHSLNTLRYADRVGSLPAAIKKLKKSPSIKSTSSQPKTPPSLSKSPSIKSTSSQPITPPSLSKSPSIKAPNYLSKSPSSRTPLSKSSVLSKEKSSSPPLSSSTKTLVSKSTSPRTPLSKSVSKTSATNTSTKSTTPKSSR